MAHKRIPQIGQNCYCIVGRSRIRCGVFWNGCAQSGWRQRSISSWAHSLGIENLSRSQVSEMTKGLNEQVEEFRNRSIAGTVYPVLGVDALYEKVRVDGRIVSMAVLIVCGVDENGHGDIIAVEPMAEESKSSYGVLFQNLKDRGLSTPRLIISDAHSGLFSAIRESFLGASWQHCKVHCMRNILAYVPQKEKKAFAAVKGNLSGAYGGVRQKACIGCDGFLCQALSGSGSVPGRGYTFPMLDARNISSSNMIERLNREIRRRTSVVGIFPNESSCVRLVTTYLMEYAEDWSVSSAYLSHESIAATLTTAA